MPLKCLYQEHIIAKIELGLLIVKPALYYSEPLLTPYLMIRLEQHADCTEWWELRDPFIESFFVVEVEFRTSTSSHHVVD